MDREGDEQSTERLHQVGQTRASDGERRDAEQAESAEPQSGDNDQRTVQGDPGQPCERRFDFQELLKELEREQLGSSTIENAFFPAPLDVAPRERCREWNAWQMLQFASLLPAAGFDEELASQGWYSSTYQQHSDRGLAEIKEKPPSPELAAFKQLEALGVLTNDDLYLPSKASDGFYTAKLAEYRAGKGSKRNQRSSGKAVTEMEKYRRRRHKEG